MDFWKKVQKSIIDIMIKFDIKYDNHHHHKILKYDFK